MLKKSGNAGHVWATSQEANKSYPKLLKIAVRLLALVPNSCSVERVCSQHKLVASKIRGRLSNKMIQMLLYCYVNMRLINNCPPTTLGFLEDILNDQLMVSSAAKNNEDPNEEIVEDSGEIE